MKNKYYNQITTKKEMSIEEAETIIDDMYQDKYKIMEQKTDTGVTIDLSKIDEITFTNLEFASVIVLREIQSLRHKMEIQEKENTDLKELLTHNELFINDYPKVEKLEQKSNYDEILTHIPRID